MARSGARAISEVLGYAAVAEVMGISVKGVIAQRARDPEFPAPVTPPELRSPGWAKVDIERYIALRDARRAGKRGRPPLAGGPRVPFDDVNNDLIHELAMQKVTMTAVAAAIGLSDTAVWMRLKKRSRWARHELETVAALLEVPIDSLLITEVPTPAPATTRTRSKK